MPDASEPTLSHGTTVQWEEWRQHGALPLLGMLGVSGSAMFAYSSGVFMGPMTTELGWTRSAFSAAFVLQMLSSLITFPLIGRLTDRVGARRVALAGIPLFVAGYSILGLVGSPVWEWWALCLLAAIGQGFIAQTVWITLIIPRFHQGRGLAFAITLAGLGVGSAIWPPLAAWAISALGWRSAFAALALGWMTIVLPLTLLLLKDEAAVDPLAPAAPGSYASAFRSQTFLGLMVAGGLFAAGYYGLSVHMVPILQARGMASTTAAGFAGLLGVFSIIGRLTTGALLDRYSTRPLAVVAFGLPAIASLLLLSTTGRTPAIAAIVLIGLASGAEMDVITFIAARSIGRAIFAATYATFSSVIAISASLGPMIAAASYDEWGSYGPFLIAITVGVLAAATLMARLPIERVAQSPKSALDAFTR